MTDDPESSFRGAGSSSAPAKPFMIPELLFGDRRWLENEPALRTAVLEAVQEVQVWTEGDREGTVVFLFADDEKMASLNSTYRGKSRPTNVLSFPCEAPAFQHSPPHMGDIALGFETVFREAGQQNKSFLSHTLHLVIHGVLHLLGYDHVTDQQAVVMENIERKVLGELGIRDPYIEIAREI